MECEEFILPDWSPPQDPARPCRPQAGYGLVMMMMMIGDDSDGDDDDNNDDNLGESFVSDRLIAMVASETIRMPGGAQCLIKIFNA